MVQLIGDLRQAMTEDLLSKKIMEVIKETRDKYPKMKKYYIVYAAKLDSFLVNAIRETFKVIDFNKKCPQEMIGSMCFLVDDSKRSFEQVWNLPYDYQGDYNNLLMGKGSSIVENSARNLVKKFKK